MGRYEAMTRYAVSSVSHGMSPRMYGRVTQEELPRARQCCSDACVLGYVSMSDEVNIKDRRIKVNITKGNPRSSHNRNSECFLSSVKRNLFQKLKKC